MFFTKAELTKLHLQFYHPSARKLYNLSKRARPETANSSLLKTVEEISGACRTCFIFSTKPRRFVVSMPPSKIVFGEEIALHLMWLNGKAVLHVVETQTHFSNAEILTGQSVEDVWRSFINCWASIYARFPSTMRLDQGSAFTSPRWKQLSETVGIYLQLSGVEGHNSLGPGERYHDPLRRIFRTIKFDHPTVKDDFALRLTVNSINCTTGPEGLTPALLVFGIQPRFPPINTTRPNQRGRMKALPCARAEMAAIAAELRVKKGFRSCAPRAAQYVLEPEQKVWVYRESYKRYIGPFSIYCGSTESKSSYS